jgi:hypothetical protein
LRHPPRSLSAWRSTSPFVNTISPKGRAAEGIPKVEFATPAKVVDMTEMQRSQVSGPYSNTPFLQVPVWVATNEYAAQLGSGVVKKDMESVRAGLLYGLEKIEIQAYLTGRHCQSDNARFTYYLNSPINSD